MDETAELTGLIPETKQVWTYYIPFADATRAVTNRTVRYPRQTTHATELKTTQP